MTAAEQAEQKRYLAAAFQVKGADILQRAENVTNPDLCIEMRRAAVRCYEQAFDLEDEAKRLELESLTVTQKGK